ncbi:BPI fold-containing family A member 2 [Erinaceus europaeus]|uniref:BPI fold-containing family A member 2 n=1 Tax=Erinaceus europaeus TaxID=9365 RepID=A0ABM3YDV5_ERIEU|nr:BPI fold-containing family A member 2 [Erinaceus europaeus]
MFQLWKLFLLCGLLTGTSASLPNNDGLLGDVDNPLNSNDLSAEGDLKPINDKELQVVGGTVDSVFQSTLGNVKTDTEQAVLKLDGYTTTINGYILKINSPQILDIKSEVTPDGKGINLRIPIRLRVSVSLPLIGQVLDLQVALDLLSGVSLKVNDETGLLGLVATECASDPASLSLSLLNSRLTLLNKILGVVTGIVENVLSTLLENVLCPVVQVLVKTLAVQDIQGITSNLNQQVNEPFVI